MSHVYFAYYMFSSRFTASFKHSVASIEQELRVKTDSLLLILLVTNLMHLDL